MQGGKKKKKKKHEGAVEMERGKDFWFFWNDREERRSEDDWEAERGGWFAKEQQLGDELFMLSFDGFPTREM